MTTAVLTAIALLAAGPGGTRATDKEPDKPPDTTKPAPDSHDAVLKDAIKLMHEVADTLDKVKDKDSAEKGKRELEAQGKKWKALAQRMKKLGKPDRDTEKALQKKFQSDLEKAQKHILQAATGLGKSPEAAAVILPALQDLAKTMMEAMQETDRE